MLIPVRRPLELSSTLLGGQAFRWREHGPWLCGVVFGDVVHVRRLDDNLEVVCAPEDEKALGPMFEDYLGLGADLDGIYASMSADERLRGAVDRHRGLRILRQDPWECLISFICSSASNLPRISRNVESICTAFGRPIWHGEHPRSLFPTPDELARAGEEPLRRLGLGFRARYVASTARAIADGKVDLWALRERSYEEALAPLTSLDGVGDKVANCVLLFSLDKPDAFPVDVWVRRAVQEWYLGYPDKKPSAIQVRLWAQAYFAPHAGYANQYLFHDRRLQGRVRVSKPTLQHR